jgi:hypothetical protein
MNLARVLNKILNFRSIGEAAQGLVTLEDLALRMEELVLTEPEAEWPMNSRRADDEPNFIARSATGTRSEIWAARDDILSV